MVGIVALIERVPAMQAFCVMGSAIQHATCQRALVKPMIVRFVETAPQLLKPTMLPVRKPVPLVWLTRSRVSELGVQAMGFVTLS
jgi:hypothetical protein